MCTAWGHTPLHSLRARARVNVPQLTQTFFSSLVFLSSDLLTEAEGQLLMCQRWVLSWTLAWRSARVCLRACVRACVRTDRVHLRKRKKCFAHSHIALKEFLDMKAGVMSVKAMFLLTQRCHAHTFRAGVCSTLQCVSGAVHVSAVKTVFSLCPSWLKVMKEGSR